MPLRLPPISRLERLSLTFGSAAVALANPARADMVALVGDLTSGPALVRLSARVQETPEGRALLAAQRPARFPAGGSAALVDMRELRDGSLGREYARFMDARGFEPEARDAVRFADNAQHAWLLQRFRDVHDVWHVLTGLPTTFMGELAQKWFELMHTGLPVCGLAAFGGPIRLTHAERVVLVTRLVPWAMRCGRGAKELLAIRYEDYLDVQVEELRREWRVSVPDVQLKGMAKRRVIQNRVPC